MSRSGRTVYFNGKALKRGNMVLGNHYEIGSGDAYWVSGIKKNGFDRHWAGAGKVAIEASAVAEYLRLVGAEELDASKFEVVADLPRTEPAAFYDAENRPL